MKDIQWNRIMVREYEYLACLSEEERIVLHDWSLGKSIVSTSMNHNMCETQIKDIRKTLREKYDAVEIYTPLLPKRT